MNTKFCSLPLALTVACFAASQAFAAGILRTVEFRDGTILRVEVPDAPLPWHKATRDGAVTREALDWNKVDQLYLVDTPALEKLAEIKGLLTKLGSNKYLDRVDAHKLLLEKGIHFRGVLEQVFKTTGDPEIRWRLEAVLKAMSTEVEPAQYNYDMIRFVGSGEEMEGDVGDWKLATNSRGSEVVLDRKNVCRVNRADMGGDVAVGAAFGRAEAILEDKDELFPKNVIRVNFDRGPNGELLTPGKDIKEAFVNLGCTLHSEHHDPKVKDPFISVEDYNVKGRSGNLCAATHDPIYQGTIIVRFCLPGNAGVPAGVHYVGFWTAYVEIEGTTLEAYDVHDRLIGAVKTRVKGNDFLALKSRTPIAYVKVKPNIEIDEDHSIDDLFFDPPVTLAEASDPKWMTVLLATGERIKCRTLARTGDKLSLGQLSIGVAKVDVPLPEVAAIMPPSELAKKPAAAGDCTVLLADGSIVRAVGGAELKTPAGAVIPADQLVALWGAGSSLTLPAEDAWPKAGALLMKDNKTIPDWKLGPKWITGAGLELFEYTYADSPLIWFRRPAEPAADAGVLRVAGGEEFVLGPGAYKIAEWSPEKVTLAKGDQKVTVPFDQVLTLRFPQKP